MESTLNEQNVTVQALITSVAATSGGEQTRRQTSSSSACKEPISEVDNLTSVIVKVSKSNERENTDSKDQKEGKDLRDNTLQLKYEDIGNTTVFTKANITNGSMKTKINEENYLQTQPNKKNGESKTCDSIKIEPGSPKLTKTVIKKDSNKLEYIKERIKQISSKLQLKKKDNESIISNPTQIEGNARILTQAITLNDVIKIEDNKESIKINPLQNQPTSINDESLSNNPTQTKVNTSIVKMEDKNECNKKISLQQLPNKAATKAKIKKNKKRLSGAQRRKAAKLKKLAIKQEESQQTGQKENVSPVTTSAEKEPIEFASEMKDTIQIIKKEPSSPNSKDKVNLGLANNAKTQTPRIKCVLFDIIKQEPNTQIDHGITTKKKNRTHIQTQEPLHKQLSEAVESIKMESSTQMVKNNDDLGVSTKTIILRQDPIQKQISADIKIIKKEPIVKNNTTNENKTETQEPVHRSGLGKDGMMAFLIANGYTRESAKLLVQKPPTFEKLRQRIIEKKARQSINVKKVCTPSCQPEKSLVTNKASKRKRQSPIEVTYPQARLQEQNTSAKKNSNKSSKQTTSEVFKKRRSSPTQPVTLDDSAIARQKVVVGFFPNSLNDVTDKILSFVQWQNEGLFAFSWKLIRRSNKNDNVMLTLLIDKISAAKLQEVRGEIFYKFRQIRLHVKDYDEKKQTATNSIHIKPIESISQQASYKRSRIQ